MEDFSPKYYFFHDFSILNYALKDEDTRHTFHSVLEHCAKRNRFYWFPGQFRQASCVGRLRPPNGHAFVQDEQDAFQELPSTAIEELESRKKYIPGKVTLIFIPMLLFGPT
jgi:hypothetical protein